LCETVGCPSARTVDRKKNSRSLMNATASSLSSGWMIENSMATARSRLSNCSCSPMWCSS
jgi:hypothetical protein